MLGPEDTGFIEVAQDCIKGKDWNDAATALQLILDNEEDFYVKVREKNPAGGAGGILAGLFPALKARRLTIVDALARG